MAHLGRITDVTPVSRAWWRLKSTSEARHTKSRAAELGRVSRIASDAGRCPAGPHQTGYVVQQTQHVRVAEHVDTSEKERPSRSAALTASWMRASAS